MTSKVSSIELAWNLRNKVGLARIKLSSGQVATFPCGSLGEIAGWAALVQAGPLVVTSDGWITSESGAMLDGGEVPFPF